MTNRRTIPGKRTAVLAHDGREWSAFLFRRDAVVRFREPGGSGAVPAGVVAFLREHRAKRARILLAGGVRRLESVPQARLSFAEVSAILANEVADQSGTDGTELVCAGGPGTLVGCIEPCFLCGVFDRREIDEVSRQLTQAGLAFDGVGSLELACAVVWNASGRRDEETLVLLGRDHGFVLPARTLPDQPGPVGLSGGTRQVERDPEAWLARFIRGNRYLAKGGLTSVFALGSDIDGVAGLLESVEELPPPRFPDPEALLEFAARQAAMGQANHFGAPVPIRNPHVPRKRFSHAFIAVPSALILALPLLQFGFHKWSLRLKEKQYSAVVNTYGPLEKRIKDAETKKSQVQARYDAAVSLQRELAERRKPMFAFIHLAYFFSKHAGNTVRLESISDTGKAIEIQGVYTDPEDGLSLEAELNTFALDKNLRILRNRVEERRDEEGRVFLGLELAVDYRDLKK